MRVLIVTPWYPNARNPFAGAFVERDAQMLRTHHDVSVVHLVSSQHADDGPSTILKDGITVHRIALQPNSPRTWWAASRTLRKLIPQFDLVHSHAATVLWPLALTRFPLAQRTPWVHTEHSSVVLQSSTTNRRHDFTTVRIRRALYSRPNELIAVSEFLAQHLGRYTTHRIRIVPNAVDSPHALSPRETLPNRVRMVSVGGLLAIKRPSIAIRTVAALRKRNVDAALTWVGDGPLRTEMEHLAAELEVAPFVRFTGSVPPDDVARFLAEADLFILPTQVETFGVAIAEALANGRPVVAGNTGGHTSFVEYRVGELVAGSNPADYADAVLAVLGRTSGLTSKEIASTLSDRFSDETRLGAYDQAYADATTRSRKKSHS